MTLSIGNNLIAKPPVLPVKGDSPRAISPQVEGSSNAVLGQTVIESGVHASLPTGVFTPALVESALLQPSLEQGITESILGTVDPSEILEWTDDVPPIEVEFKDIEPDKNKKVNSVDSDSDGTEEEDSGTKGNNLEDKSSEQEEESIYSF